MDKQQAYDNYGFKTTAISLMMDKYLKDPERDKQRIDFWQKILNSNLSIQQQKKIFREQVRKGVPDQLRPRIWAKLITPPLKPYSSVSITEYLKQIDRDINRTISSNKRQSQLKLHLRNMLNILAVAFPKMSYCQGLNFITANLLLILDEQQTYNTMYHILYWQGHEKLMTELERIHMKLHVLKRGLIAKHYPILAKHLEKMEVQPMLYAPSWFITIFTNSLPCQYVFRILEIYLVEGEKIMYRVALQIMKEKKKIIKKLTSQEEIIFELKNYDEFNSAIIDKFFREMFEINLSRKEIQMYQDQFQNQKNQ